MKDVPTDYVACVVDPKGKTFRSDIYPDYKANRPPMPEDLSVQIPLIFEGVQKEGIPFLQIPGIEADDTIGTLTKKAVEEGFNVVIATGDKDFAQLVNDNVLLVNTMGKDNSWLNSEGVEKKFGVPPERSSISSPLWAIRSITFRAFPSAEKRPLLNGSLNSAQWTA